FPPFLGDMTAEVERSSPIPGYVAKYSKRKIDDCFGSVFFGKTGELVQRQLELCTAKATPSPRLIFVGDSFATDLFPMADKMYHDGVATVINLSKTGCRTPRLENEESVCGYVDLILGLVKDTRSGSDILVIRNNYTPRYMNG